ncbi:MAG: hypothetical protein LC647_11560 [Beggiatoa sp.]|nr:hypothetical protein [Beggiatoa sp.]
MPRSTAHEFIQNANEDNTLIPDAPILVLHRDQLCWQSSLFLDVWYGHIFGTVQKVIRIDAGDVDMKVVAQTAGDEAFFDVAS